VPTFQGAGRFIKTNKFGKLIFQGEICRWGLLLIFKLGAQRLGRMATLSIADCQLGIER
jgi:hypothetical protein